MLTSTNSAGKPHFATLDGLRGIAAVSVVILHWFEGLGYSIFGASMLAVDFFFMLSGFVVAYSYEERLQKGFSFFKFMLLRIIRLHPMIILGAILGLLRYETKSYLETGGFSLEYLFQFFLAITMIPESLIRVDQSHEFFAINIAFWSLFCEFTAYILFGLLLFRLNKFTLFLIASTAFVGFCFWTQSSFGVQDSPPEVSIYYRLSRVVFSFTVGVILFRSRESITALAQKWPSYMLLLLPLLLILPRHVLPWYVFALLAIILLPTTIIVGVKSNFDGRTAKTVNFLGDISFPVYAVHTPLLWGMGFLVKKMGVTNPNQIVWFGLIIIPVTIGLSYMALKLYDEPLRKYLKSRFSNYLHS
jgi:peptidoglycan/LPS O-acetylase OafA/YrhL